MLIENLVVKPHDFAPREGVQIAAERVGLGRNPRRRTLARPFEQRVFYEMRQAMPFNGFVSRTDAQEYAETDRAHMRYCFRYYYQPVIELRSSHIETLIN